MALWALLTELAPLSRGPPTPELLARLGSSRPSVTAVIPRESTDEPEEARTDGVAISGLDHEIAV